MAGGIFGLVTAYAPHNLYDLSDRFAFYVALDSLFRKLSANVAKIIVGDLNARLGAQLLEKITLSGLTHSVGEQHIQLKHQTVIRCWNFAKVTG